MAAADLNYEKAKRDGFALCTRLEKQGPEIVVELARFLRLQLKAYDDLRTIVERFGTALKKIADGDTDDAAVAREALKGDD